MSNTSTAGHEDLDLLTIDEAVEVLKVSADRLAHWRCAEPPIGPPFIKLSSQQVRYRRSRLIKWLAEREVDTAA